MEKNIKAMLLQSLCLIKTDERKAIYYLTENAVKAMKIAYLRLTILNGQTIILKLKARLS